MKKWLLLVGLVALFLSEAAMAADDFFTKIKINLSSSHAPNIRNSSNATVSASASWRNKWLIIAVDDTPVAPEKGMRNAWINDVEMRVRAVFNGQSDGKTQAFYFSGSSLFWTIPLDNRKHIATMMIPPQLLDRYLPSGGSASTVNLGNTFTIEVLFLNRAGVVIGRGYYGRRGLSDEEYANYFSKLGGAATEISGAILPRNETPWAFMDIDDYDLLKSGGAAQQSVGNNQ